MQMLLQNISLLFLNLLGSCVPVSLHQHFSGFMVLFGYVDYLIYCLETKVHLILKETNLLCLSHFLQGDLRISRCCHNLTVK